MLRMVCGFVMVCGLRMVLEGFLEWFWKGLEWFLEWVGFDMCFGAVVLECVILKVWVLQAQFLKVLFWSEWFWDGLCWLVSGFYPVKRQHLILLLFSFKLFFW